MQKERYEGIDGLKAYAIIGIALMHVLSNGKYEIGGSKEQLKHKTGEEIVDADIAQQMETK